MSEDGNPSTDPGAPEPARPQGGTGRAGGAGSPAGSPRPASAGRRDSMQRVLNNVTAPARPDGVHPALIPGLGVERTGRKYSLNIPVFILAAIGVAAVALWGAFAPGNLEAVSGAALSFVTRDVGWFFSVLAIAVFVFMLWLGFGRYRHIRLGRDDEAPEFSTVSWVAMLFSAGIGIGLIFYGPSEPLTYFLDLPPIYAGMEEGSQEAVHAAINQTLFHWGPIAWAFYALVGGAVAYASYRKGRLPLMSALLEPIFGKRTEGPLGAVVDILAILVTLFSVAISLGIGALQIGTGFEIVTGMGPLGNAATVGIIALLCAVFVTSAVSGIKRGIRALSNINMVLAGLVGVFVLVTGPTVLLLNLIPGVGMTFLSDLLALLGQSAASGGPEAADFMGGWTIYYWAWWVSWTPFVGMFIAKISRGRTLREFVFTVIIVPSAVCSVWFTIIGGTSLWMEQETGLMSQTENTEQVFFTMLDQLPLSGLTSLIVMVSIIIFFVTSGDSASVIMSSIAERGSPAPKLWNTAIWGVGMAVIAAVLLVGTGEAALGQLQSLMMISALPFALVLVLIMVAWAKDLARDPLILRHRYADEALHQGVRAGIEEHGDDFTLSVEPAEEGKGAGAWLDSEDPALSEWYTSVAPEAGPAEDASGGPGEHGEPGPGARAGGGPDGPAGR
ncbi:BCCT family transporter [Sediminivirga luteola]|uniref:BCCT family transporter n=1 Tax=Sediminivirga luteola TaxID=1774748 RepID=UPI001F57A33B|nr:BCCT family transporter [Sediminivirga luteola]MCI2264423.1 BCCT family transporter [Sediminivirga luteola]